jgi:hypothetical protein
MVYLGSKASFSTNLEKVKAADPVKAFWIDPRSGSEVPIGTCRKTGVESFSMPDA